MSKKMFLNGLTFIAIFLLGVLFGCQTNDFKASLIIEGQSAQHAGYNVGPGLYLEKGDLAKVTGALIYAKGMDPNSLSRPDD